MPGREVTDAELEAAVEALTDRERFRAAEARVARVAPGLQRILAEALREGGWLDEVHDSEVRKAVTYADDAERLTAIRALLAEETRMGMLVGVAIGWELALELGEPVNPSQPLDEPAGARSAGLTDEPVNPSRPLDEPAGTRSAGLTDKPNTGGG